MGCKKGLMLVTTCWSCFSSLQTMLWDCLFGEKNFKQIIVLFYLLVKCQIGLSFHSEVEKLYSVTSDFCLIKLLMFCRLELLLQGHNLSCIIHKWHKCHPNHIFIQMDHRWDFTRSYSLVTLNGQKIVSAI